MRWRQAALIAPAGEAEWILQLKTYAKAKTNGGTAYCAD